MISPAGTSSSQSCSAASPLRTERPPAGGDSRRLAPAYVAPPSGVRYSAQFVVRNAKGRPVADFPYLIVDGAGKEYRGRTNTAGETARRYSSVYTRFELYPDETVEQGGNGLEVCKEC